MRFVLYAAMAAFVAILAGLTILLQRVPSDPPDCDIALAVWCPPVTPPTPR